MRTQRQSLLILILGLILLSVSTILAAPPRVTVANGNLWLTDAQGHLLQSWPFSA